MESQLHESKIESKQLQKDKLGPSRQNNLPAKTIFKISKEKSLRTNI